MILLLLGISALCNAHPVPEAKPSVLGGLGKGLLGLTGVAAVGGASYLAYKEHKGNQMKKEAAACVALLNQKLTSFQLAASNCPIQARYIRQQEEQEMLRKKEEYKEKNRKKNKKKKRKHYKKKEEEEDYKEKRKEDDGAGGGVSSDGPDALA